MKKSATQKDKAPCSVENCLKPVKSRKMCSTHYEAWRRKNPITDENRLRSGGKSLWNNADGSRMTCTLGSCGDPIEAQGMCLRHYQHMWYMSKQPYRQRKNRSHRDDNGNPVVFRCTFEGCNKIEFNPGLCAGHYYQRNRGEELRPLLEKRTCPVNGCTKQYRTDLGKYNLCGSHVALRRKYGLEETELVELFKNRVCANEGCGGTENLHIDHDHSCCPRGSFPTQHQRSCGKCVRGFLCQGCNTALGSLKENRERILGLLRFLENPLGV